MMMITVVVGFIYMNMAASRAFEMQHAISEEDGAMLQQAKLGSLEG